MAVLFFIWASAERLQQDHSSAMPGVLVGRDVTDIKIEKFVQYTNRGLYRAKK